MEKTIRLREEQLELCRKVAGLTTDAALARKMNVSPATVSRVLREHQPVSSAFMAQLLAAFDQRLDIPDLFELDTLEDAP